jgi:glucose/arabinose dehydrogenase
MQSMFKKLLFLCFFGVINQTVLADNFKLEKLTNLNQPWSLTFINENEILISEKSGSLILYNKKNKKKFSIPHNLKFNDNGQGGLLEILNFKNDIYICYSEDRGEGKTSTSIAKAKFSKSVLDFNNIFQAQSPIKSGYHFGCRMVIQDTQYLYASIGERGQGNIAQDPSQHPGSIIRINLDGSIPKNNPKFLNKTNWLSEIYQIGIRNPQGMTLSPTNNKIYISNHGARGGDFFGEVKFAENYGWKIYCWGGTNYTGLKCGDTQKWDKRFTKPLYTWVPSIAVSAVKIYQGNEFKEWNGQILMTSLKDQSLRKLEFINENEVGNEKVIFKNKIGRLRDIKIDQKGKIYLLSNGDDALWVMKKNN